MVSEVASEIKRLRNYLTMPPDEVPEDWRVFVREYQRQKEQAEAWVVSDDPDLRRRGKILLKNLEAMK